MKTPLIRWLLNVYPSTWRAEYGPELKELLDAQPMSVSGVCNILWSGLKERARQPFARLFLCWMLGSVTAFILSEVFADTLWNLAAGPAGVALRGLGIKPPLLVMDSPFQGPEIVYLGVPFAATAFVSFPWVLILIGIFFGRVQDIKKRRWVANFLLFSGTVFALSALASLVAWQSGASLRLLGQGLAGSTVSVGSYFKLFFWSTLGLTSFLQLPIFAVFGWRFGRIRTQKAPSPAA